MTPLTERIEQFLSTSGKDRKWLADEIGCSKGTLNNWLSPKGDPFPAWAEKSIERLIAEQTRAAVGDDDYLNLSVSEWQEVFSACAATGAKSIHEFIAAAVKARAAEVNSRQSTSSKPSEDEN